MIGVSRLSETLPKGALARSELAQPILTSKPRRVLEPTWVDLAVQTTEVLGTRQTQAP